MCDRFISNDDSSPKGREAETPILPLPVLSRLAEANSSLSSDDIFKPVRETLLTLLDQTFESPMSRAKVHKPGSLSNSSVSISFSVSRSSASRSLLSFISSIIVLAFSGESICTKTDNRYNLISTLSG